MYNKIEGELIMAKFAQVTYGSHGDTQSYTYVVNDNIRKGAVVYPNVTHHVSGKEFTTMGIVQDTTKVASNGRPQTYKGQEWVGEMLVNDVHGIKRIKTGDELGVYQSQMAQRNAQGQIIKDPNKMPTKATETTEGGMKAITTDPTQHLKPQESPFTKKLMEAQLNQAESYEIDQRNMTIYGFETDPKNRR